jgi:hypothetical protein
MLAAATASLGAWAGISFANGDSLSVTVESDADGFWADDGNTVVGSILTASGAGGTLAEGNAFSYVWRTTQTSANCPSTVGVGNTYTVEEAVVDCVIFVEVSDDVLDVESDSATVRALAITNNNVTGTATGGETLTAAADFTEDAGVKSYQWERNSDAGAYELIVGADDPTYLLGAGDIGFRVRVVVGVTVNAESVTNQISSATLPVARATRTVTIVDDDSSVEGDTFTVSYS